MITFFFSLHITGDAVIQKPVDIPSEEVFFRSHDNGYWKMQTFLKIIVLLKLSIKSDSLYSLHLDKI